jgi:hypothetical protein
VQRASGISSAFAGMEAELFECAQERTPARPSDSQSNPKFSSALIKLNYIPTRAIGPRVSDGPADSSYGAWSPRS